MDGPSLLLDDVGPAVPVVVPAEDHHLAVEHAAGAVLPRVVGGARLHFKHCEGFTTGLTIRSGETSC